MSPIPPVAPTVTQPGYSIHAGVVLSRPPLITRDLHPFESAFFLYQRRLNERLALPFTRYFYFKKKTPADIEWKRKIKDRLTPARDIGRYKGYGDEAWNDEVLVGAEESNVQWQVERLLEDAEKPAAKGEAEHGAGTSEVEAKPDIEAIEKPMPRVTEADLKNDVKSLNRMLQRTLYLLVKNKEGKWAFPADRLVGKEALHSVRKPKLLYLQSTDKQQAAERILLDAGGINMNTWLIGRVPVGHHQIDFTPQTAKNPNELGLKTFFMRARIMAGQLNLTDNKLGLSDFKWLAKEEVEKEVDRKYWHSVKNMLAER